MGVRRHGAAPSGARRHRMRPGVYAVIRLGGGVLLTAQAGGDGAPELQLPGGGVDPGEQPLAALHREVLEETGWRIAAPRRVGAFREFKAVPASAFGAPAAPPPGPGAALGRERIWARTRAGPAVSEGGAAVGAEKLCTIYAARAAIRLGAPSEPGHAALVLPAAHARLALVPILFPDGGAPLLDRALAMAFG